MTLNSTEAGLEGDFAGLALAFAERANSDDPKAAHVRQSGVGAVIVGKLGVLARSANVLPPRLKQAYLDGDLSIPEADRYHVIEHAERAAIFKAMGAGADLEGATLYCTRFPCSDCARAIVWSGINRMVSSSGLEDEARWVEAQRSALQMLSQSGVEVVILDCEDNTGVMAVV
jgi:dCMP deaminase